MKLERPDRLKVQLHGVPETALLTLHYRALAARMHPDEFHDPWAIDLVERIDFPFTQRFGSWATGARFIGGRALTFDRTVREILTTDPDAMVVALGEGLETQRWRVDNGTVEWLTVELPSTAAVRERLLNTLEPKSRMFVGSALEDGWFDAVTNRRGQRVIVIAQGLLMYLPSGEVEALISRCARRFRRGALIFDTIPPWAGALTRRGVTIRGYTPPPMPWNLPGRAHQSLRRLDPHIAQTRDVQLARLSGILPCRVLPALERIPRIRTALPSVVRIDFD